MKTISILGCGWLGLPLASSLARAGWSVKGSTTRAEKIPELLENKIEPFQITFNPDLMPGEGAGFFDSSVLLINFPPRLRQHSEDFHLQQIDALIREIEKSPVRDIIFISSTSVYQDLNREMTEEDADPDHVIIKAENKLWDFATGSDRRITILRCGGLMGYDRIPCKYYSGKKDLTNGQTPVNYIHQDDVVNAILTVIIKNVWNDRFNLVAPGHPVRKDVMTDCSGKTLYTAPEFIKSTKPEPFKIISSAKFLEATQYKFKYPDPLGFEYYLQ